MRSYSACTHVHAHTHIHSIILVCCNIKHQPQYTYKHTLCEAVTKCSPDLWPLTLRSCSACTYMHTCTHSATSEFTLVRTYKSPTCTHTNLVSVAMMTALCQCATVTKVTFKASDGTNKQKLLKIIIGRRWQSTPASLLGGRLDYVGYCHQAMGTVQTYETRVTVEVQ